MPQIDLTVAALRSWIQEIEFFSPETEHARPAELALNGAADEAAGAENNGARWRMRRGVVVAEHNQAAGASGGMPSV